jgi:hypothetical protein
MLLRLLLLAAVVQGQQLENGVQDFSLCRSQNMLDALLVMDVYTYYPPRNPGMDYEFPFFERSSCTDLNDVYCLLRWTTNLLPLGLCYAAYAQYKPACEAYNINLLLSSENIGSCAASAFTTNSMQLDTGKGIGFRDRYNLPTSFTYAFETKFQAYDPDAVLQSSAPTKTLVIHANASPDRRVYFDFFSQGTYTLWTKLPLTGPAFGFNPVSQSNMTLEARKIRDMNIFWGLPYNFFERSDISIPNTATFNANGFVFSCMSTSMDFSPVKTKRGKKFASLNSPAGVVEWGILTSACAPPTFDLGIFYKTFAQGCVQRQIQVTSIGALSGWQCVQPQSTGSILTKFEQGLNKDAVLAWLQESSDYAKNYDTGQSVRASKSMAAQYLDCAQKAGSYYWRFPSGGGSPGVCAPCSLSSSSRSKKVSVPCGSELASARNNAGCCFRCAPGYMWNPVDTTTCVRKCKVNQKYGVGGCQDCEAGKYSNSFGSSTACQNCAVNEYSNPTQGCVDCGSRSQVALGKRGCDLCAVGKYVKRNTSVCTLCNAGQYLPNGLVGYCLDCPPGYFNSDQTKPVCEPCSASASLYQDAAGRTACKTCPTGSRAFGNRTGCVGCAVNLTRLPFAQYRAGDGCTLECNRSVAYAVGPNAGVPGGCVACSTVQPVVGHYLVPLRCNQQLPCTKAPSSNSFYTAGSRLGDSCEWRCKDGYVLSPNGSACLPCSAVGFNRSLHIWTSGCNFTCAKGLYRDAALLCNTRCLDLSLVELPARVREYPAAAQSRRSFLFGHCGLSELFGVRPRYAVEAAAGRCGDSTLDAGEACDDGNAVGGDGCSSSCQLETHSFYDCDLVGTPCLPQCGWKVDTDQPWGLSLRNFLLPPARATCYNISEYDCSLQPVESRTAWMLEHLISCRCPDPSRQLLYEECQQTGAGCRTCRASEEYHDDVRQRCVACGSVCSIGYTSSSSDARCASSTTDAMSMPTLSEQQWALGCAPCPGSSFERVYMSGCAFSCARPQWYCSRAVGTSGVCNSSCFACENSLRSVTNELESKEEMGYYITSCADGVGHSTQRCEPLALPANAIWSGHSYQVGASSSCPWVCQPGALPVGPSTCLVCSPSITSCSSGSTLQPCITGNLCYPCALLFPDYSLPPFTQWYTSTPSFDTCRVDCQPGISWDGNISSSSSAGSSGFDVVRGSCFLCSQPVCGVGQTLEACTTRSDATCLPCPPAAAGWELYLEGSCAARCASGYFSLDGDCVSCAAVSCSPGTYRSSQCLLAPERLSSPVCLPCSPPLQPNGTEVWAAAAGEGCSRACRAGLWRDGNGTCTTCNLSRCDVGFTCSCNSSAGLVQEPCAPLLQAYGVAYVERNSCRVGCAEGFARNSDDGVCFPVPSGGGTTPPAPPAATTSNRALYPKRTLSHS